MRAIIRLARLPTVALVWMLLASGPFPAIGQTLAGQIDVARPAPGRTVEIQAEPAQIYNLTFPPQLPQTQVLDDNFVLGFDDDGDGKPDSFIVFRNLVTASQGDRPPDFVIAGTAVSSSAIVNQAIALEGQDGDEAGLEIAAAQSGCLNCGGGPLSIYSLRVTGRDLLFPGEKERSGHPLYSYLLFAGAREGSREERARFRSAVKAFVGQFSSVEVLERSGAARGEINVFYAPIKQVTRFIKPPSPSGYFFNLGEDKQAEVLQEYYDHGRAEVLIARMGLAGNGPFIVSVLKPLGDHPVSESGAFLVQDLSGVPPDLVALWVDEFKRQVVKEATGSPERLRRLALNLRTQIAVLAEAFSITRTAVAEMFDGSVD